MLHQTTRGQPCNICIKGCFCSWRQNVCFKITVLHMKLDRMRYWTASTVFALWATAWAPNRLNTTIVRWDTSRLRPTWILPLGRTVLDTLWGDLLAASAHLSAEQTCCLLGSFRSQALDSHSSRPLHRELTSPSTARNSRSVDTQHFPHKALRLSFFFFLVGRDFCILSDRSISNIRPFNVMLQAASA